MGYRATLLLSVGCASLITSGVCGMEAAGGQDVALLVRRLAAMERRVTELERAGSEQDLEVGRILRIEDDISRKRDELRRFELAAEEALAEYKVIICLPHSERPVARCLFLSDLCDARRRACRTLSDEIAELTRQHTLLCQLHRQRR